VTRVEVSSAMSRRTQSLNKRDINDVRDTSRWKKEQKRGWAEDESTERVAMGGDSWYYVTADDQVYGNSQPRVATAGHRQRVVPRQPKVCDPTAGQNVCN
jgi:hypothetical protein